MIDILGRDENNYSARTGVLLGPQLYRVILLKLALQR